jgi:hypothetical protein
MIFRYYAEKSTGKVTWVPKPTEGNPGGLPAEGAPWRFVAGLDIGYEAPTALVIAAYSQKLGQLRHVEDISRTHMLVPDLADLLHEMQDKYGPFEKVFADMGNLGKMIVRTLVEQHGFPLEKADKREKYDFIELLNGGFSAVRFSSLRTRSLRSNSLRARGTSASSRTPTTPLRSCRWRGSGSSARTSRSRTTAAMLSFICTAAVSTTSAWTRLLGSSRLVPPRGKRSARSTSSRSSAKSSVVRTNRNTNSPAA